MTNLLKNNTLTGYHLKMIALVTMFIDHVAAVVIWRFYEASYHITEAMKGSQFIGDKIVMWVSQNQELIYTIYEMMRMIGRMAFPIYCFLLVEGFLHTRSVGKYALRLLLFAFLSEIPFDLAITGSWYSSDYGNVFFTLCLGLILIWGISFVEKFYEFWQEKNWDLSTGKAVSVFIGAMMTIAVGAFGEMVLHCDYGFGGILTILAIYLFRQSKEIAFGFAVFVLTIFCGTLEILALLMLYPIQRYDGSRGKSLKYVFYAFYPVHLLVLGLVCMACGV